VHEAAFAAAAVVAASLVDAALVAVAPVDAPLATAVPAAVAPALLAAVNNCDKHAPLCQPTSRRAEFCIFVSATWRSTLSQLNFLSELVRHRPGLSFLVALGLQREFIGQS
jgi:hypothetical protein